MASIVYACDEDSFIEKFQQKELINGEVVMLAACSALNHNRVVRNIVSKIDTFLKGKTCEVFGDNTKLYLDENNKFIPDLMIVCDQDKVKDNHIEGAPDLVVEVLSPSTARNDRITKLFAYEKAGVREYWIVSPSEKSVTVYIQRDGKLVLEDYYTIIDDDDEKEVRIPDIGISFYEDFKMSLAEVFDRV